jgi:hypothetical protein
MRVTFGWPAFVHPGRKVRLTRTLGSSIEETRMKKVFWLIVGIKLGFIAAHLINQNPAGKKFFENVDSKAREFGKAVAAGYRERDAELRSAVSEMESSLNNLNKRL